MAKIEGQVETVTRLKDVLRANKISRFQSVGDIRQFLSGYESELAQTLPRAEREIEGELQGLKSALAKSEASLNQRITDIQAAFKFRSRGLIADIEYVDERATVGGFFGGLWWLRLFYLRMKLSSLKNKTERLISRGSRKEREKTSPLRRSLHDLETNRNDIAAARSRNMCEELNRTKQVVDAHYNLIAGAIGENDVVNTIRQLPDDYYLLNDLSIKFDRPIFNKNRKDRIRSIQADHVLVGPTGVFVLETKNWSKSSVNNLDLRSPVEQIQRTGYALFVVLNGNSKTTKLLLQDHPWGARQIPLKNVIVMTNYKPKEEFKHVKIVSLDNLIGYVQYFDPVLSDREPKRIVEYLKSKM